MENTDKTLNEKPKGNMLQNENREDEASTEMQGETETSKSKNLNKQDSIKENQLPKSSKSED